MKAQFPRKCECGGKLKYTRDFGMVFVYCKSCTPVIKCKPPWTLTLTGKGREKPT